MACSLSIFNIRVICIHKCITDSVVVVVVVVVIIWVFFFFASLFCTTCVTIAAAEW